MRILLVGEYSRLHNSLKEGLIKLGHEVVIIAQGDGFKAYPVDIKIDAPLFKHNYILRKIKNIAFLLFKVDLAGIELLFNLKRMTKNLQEFDVIQLINSNCFLTLPSIEKKIFNHLSKLSKKKFLKSAGNDVYWVYYMLNKHQGYSSLTSYINDKKNLKKSFLSALKYTQKEYIEHYSFLI